MRSLVIGAGGSAAVFVDEDDVALGEEPFAYLPSVAGAVEGVARALHQAGVQASAPVLNPTADDFRHAWDAALSSAAGRPLIVHFSGHGEQQEGTLYLAVQGSQRGSRLRATSVEVSALVKDAQAAASPVLFLLDVCQAGQAVTEQLVRELILTTGATHGAQARKVWMIGACSAHEITRQAVFSRATTAVLRRLAGGLLDVSPALKFVPVETFAAEVAREVARSGGIGQCVVRTPTDVALEEVPGFFPNHSFARDAPSRFLAGVSMALQQLALAVDPGVDLLHFATRAAGNQRVDVCQFSGRTAHLKRIREWIDNAQRDQPRLLVITGGPGTGKSALLGVTACLLHPELQPLRRQVRARLPDFDPRPEAKVLAIHARQLTAHQIIQSLCRQLSAPASGTGVGTDEPEDGQRREGTTHAQGGIDDLVTLMRFSGAVVIVLDALDEAIDPAAVVRDLITPLVGDSEQEGVPGCRIMVGTRPWWEALSQLHERAFSTVGDVLALDPTTAADRESLAGDLAEYLKQLLDEHYPVTTPRAVADRLATHAQTGAFLIAALFADHLVQQAMAGRPLSDAEIRTRLPCSITEVFDLHTQSLAATDRWFLPVLQVLGQARGMGMPLALLHEAALAHAALADGTSLAPTQDDTRQVLLKASFYLRTAPDSDHRLLYRYFHQALNEHTTAAIDAVAVHKALAASIPLSADGRPQWEFAHPYLKRHAAAHALAAGVEHLDELLSDPGFLLHADPDGLVPYLHHAATDTAVHHAHVYRSTLPQHPKRSDVSSRRGLLALDAAAWHNASLAAALALPPLENGIPPAVPVWATNSTAHPALLHTFRGLAGTAGAVSAVAPHRGGALAVSSDGDRVQVWDITTGKQMSSLDQPARALATVALLDGRSLAVTSDGGKAQVWNIATGEPVSALDGPTRSIAAVALPDGSALALTTDGGRARVWDLMTGQHQRFLSTRGRSGAAVAAVALSSGRALGITGDRTRKALVWDLNTGKRLMTLNSHSAAVRAVAAVALPDGRAFAVTASIGGAAVVWNLLTGKQHCKFNGHAAAVHSVATVVTEDGRPLAITADRTRKALVWDLNTGKRLMSLTGQHRAVDAVTAVALPDGRALAITADRAGLATVWDLASSAHPQRPVPGHSRPVQSALTAALPHGQEIAMTSGGSVTFVWDLDTGHQLHTLNGHERFHTLEVLKIDGHGLAMTTDQPTPGNELVWDLETGACLTPRKNVAPGSKPGPLHVALPKKPVLTITTGHGRVTRVENRVTGEVAHTAARSRWTTNRRVMLHDPQDGGSWIFWDPATESMRRAVIGSPRSPQLEDLLERWQNYPRHQRAEIRGWLRSINVRRELLELRHANPWTRYALLEQLRWNHHPFSRHALSTAEAELLRHDPENIDDLDRYLHWDTLDASKNRVFAVIDDRYGPEVWELTGHRDICRLRHYTSSVNTMTITHLPDGRHAAVLANHEGEIRVWDLAEDRQIGSPLTLPRPAQVVTATTAGLIAGYGSEVAYLSWNTNKEGPLITR
ncbi:AAA family ATPase [Streptomyces sp. NPDC001513]|uniref:AAA family ATPase n=1 Tax=Streptomyces sp. NPDC001513 TaxID=3364580 RepID=UPI0036A5A7EA